MPARNLPVLDPLLARTRLQPDTRHEFPGRPDHPVATVRLDAYPDGGARRRRSR